MRCAILAVLITSGSLLSAQDASELLETDFLSVAIEGSLNLRAGPTTESERLMRLEDGRLLRRIECLSEADEAWCEVETLDGSIEGWAAARFLRPWYGADPAALQTPTLAAHDRLSVEAPGRFAGKLDRGKIFDLLVDVPIDREIAISVDTSEGIGHTIFATDGSVIETGHGEAELSFVSLTDDSLMIRFADVSGEPGEWSLDVTSE